MTVTDQEKILNYLKFTGPTTPSRIAKNIKQEVLFTSAHLSDLRAQGKIKISNLKIGTSPLYYLAGQESQLYPFAAGNINPKDLEVLDLLKDKKVLAEASLDLLGKVAIRNLKDFAIPLHVTLEDKTGLFWKWHLLSTEEANVILSEMVNQIRSKNLPTFSIPEVQLVQSPTRQLPEIQQGIQLPKIESPTLEVLPSMSSSSISAIKSSSVPPAVPSAVPLDREELKPKIKEAKPNVEKVPPKVERKSKKEEQRKIESEINKTNTEATPELSAEISKIWSIERGKDGTTEATTESSKQVRPEISLEAVIEPPTIKSKNTRKKRTQISEELLPLIHTFFQNLKIGIEQQETVRKNLEFNLLIIVPCAVGSVKYFCKVKSKAKCDEKDISAAYMEAQIKKLPLLFVYTNELSTKAEEVLASGAFENLMTRKIKWD